MKALVQQFTFARLNIFKSWETRKVNPKNPRMNSLSIMGSPDAVSGLTGLEINGKRYEVYFVKGNYNKVYRYQRPRFLENLKEAKAAAFAIADAFNTLGVSKLVGSAEYVNIPCQLTTHTYEEMYLEKDGKTWSAEHFSDFSTTPSTYYLETQRVHELYTRFSPL